MKEWLFQIVLFCFGFSCFGQNFAPFNPEKSKRFINMNSSEDSMYYFYADSSYFSNDTLVIDQYLTYKNVDPDNLDASECDFWGDPIGIVTDTTWLGTKVLLSPENVLFLENFEEETLQFDFNLGLNDSSQFYTDGMESYYLKAVSVESDALFGQEDQIKTFEIKVYDSNDLPVENALHNFEIQVGEEFGLIQFFDVFHFPDTAVKLRLEGQTNPILGNYQMTLEQAFTWNEGDIIQYRTTQSIDINAPLLKTYQQFTITSREETSDSVHIYFDSEYQLVVDGNFLDPWPSFVGITSPLSFAKDSLIVNRPYNYAIRDGSFIEYSLENSGSCPGNEQLSIAPDFITYCDFCQCYGPYDGFQVTLETSHYTENRGLTGIGGITYGPPGVGTGSSMIYSEIGGIICGNFFPLSSASRQRIEFEVFPNPSSKTIEIHAPFEFSSLLITDMLGRVIYDQTFHMTGEREIDLTNFLPGTYLVRISDGSNLSKPVRFVKP